MNNLRQGYSQHWVCCKAGWTLKQLGILSLLCFIWAGQTSPGFCLLTRTFISLISSGSGRTSNEFQPCSKPWTLPASFIDTLQMFKRKETIIFIVLTVGIIILTLLQLDQTFFIYGFGQLLLYFIFGCTLIYGIFRLIGDRRPISFIDKSKPLILALTIIGFFFLLSHLVDTDGGKKRVITGGFDHDLNFVYFQLFDDNKFKFLNSGPFGGTFYRGTYTLKNDTLKFDNESLKIQYPSLTFVLKQNEKEKYFDPIDTLKSMYRLSIYKDFRPHK
jgi:hypothetical protein